MLQSCMDSIKNEPDSGSEECVTTLDDGSEFSIEVEEADIKLEEADIKLEEADIKIEETDIKIEESGNTNEENPEVITVSPIKTKPEVSVWGLCVRRQHIMLPTPFTATKR